MAAVTVSAATVVAATRPPAVAGAFYTDDPQALRLQVEQLFEAVDAPSGTLRAVVAPHAGYVFSGATAARAFAGLAAAEPARVILLGPSHYEGYAGGALPAASIDAFATPLGEVKVDRAAVEALRSHLDFRGPSSAHGPEHSLEVELPFIQVAAPRARIVPVLVGYHTGRPMMERMALALAPLLDEHTVVVVSSDFTHHGARYGYAPFSGRRDLGDVLIGLGRTTAERVAAVDPDGFWAQVEVSGDTVCGRRPIALLTELLARTFEGTGSVTAVTTSGHVSGSFEMSVTYASVVFTGAWHPWRDRSPAGEARELDESERRRMLELARATLKSHLAHDESLAKWFAGRSAAEALDFPAGAFVTVHNTGADARRHGKLRACMGVIEARDLVVDVIISAAVSAAHDPRFPELTLDELDRVELEVSVLSPARKVSAPEQIIVGKHGVVLSKGRHSAVYLPQVAPEQGWNREEMLDHLSQKAGLPADGWRSGATFEVFTAQVFAEGS